MDEEIKQNSRPTDGISDPYDVISQTLQKMSLAHIHAERHQTQTFRAVADEYKLLHQTIHFAEPCDILIAATESLQPSVWESWMPEYFPTNSIAPTDPTDKMASAQKACLLTLKSYHEELTSHGVDDFLGYLCIIATFKDKVQPHANSQSTDEVHVLMDKLRPELDDLWMEIRALSPALSGYDVLWQAIHCCPQFLQFRDILDSLDWLRESLTDPRAILRAECTEFWHQAKEAAKRISRSAGSRCTEHDVQRMFIGKLLVAENILKEWRVDVGITGLTKTMGSCFRQMEIFWPKHREDFLQHQNHFLEVRTDMLKKYDATSSRLQFTLLLLEQNYQKDFVSIKEIKEQARVNRNICVTIDDLVRRAFCDVGSQAVEDSTCTNTVDVAPLRPVQSLKEALETHTNQETLLAELFQHMEGLGRDIVVWRDTHPDVPPLPFVDERRQSQMPDCKPTDQDAVNGPQYARLAEDHRHITSGAPSTYHLKKRRDSKPPMWYEDSSVHPITGVPKGDFKELHDGVMFMNQVMGAGKWQVWRYGTDGNWCAQKWGEETTDGQRLIITPSQNWPGFVSERYWEKSYKQKPELIMIYME